MGGPRGRRRWRPRAAMVAVTNYASLGWVVLIEHSPALATAYIGLDSPSVEVGARVRQGQALGSIGGSPVFGAGRMAFRSTALLPTTAASRYRRRSERRTGRVWPPYSFRLSAAANARLGKHRPARFIRVSVETQSMNLTFRVYRAIFFLSVKRKQPPGEADFLCAWRATTTLSGLPATLTHYTLHMRKRERP